MLLNLFPPSPNRILDMNSEFQVFQQKNPNPWNVRGIWFAVTSKSRVEAWGRYQIHLFFFLYLNLLLSLMLVCRKFLIKQFCADEEALLLPEE